MTRNRHLAQDMWRLEDKVEGSQRFTASGYSERTRENLVGLDGVSAKYNDDDNDDDDKEEEGEENSERSILGDDRGKRRTAALYHCRNSALSAMTHPLRGNSGRAYFLTKPTFRD